MERVHNNVVVVVNPFDIHFNLLFSIRIMFFLLFFSRICRSTNQINHHTTSTKIYQKINKSRKTRPFLLLHHLLFLLFYLLIDLNFSCFESVCIFLYYVYVRAPFNHIEINNLCWFRHFYSTRIQYKKAHAFILIK